MTYPLTHEGNMKRKEEIGCLNTTTDAVDASDR